MIIPVAIPRQWLRSTLTASLGQISLTSSVKVVTSGICLHVQSKKGNFKRIVGRRKTFWENFLTISPSATYKKMPAAKAKM